MKKTVAIIGLTIFILAAGYYVKQHTELKVGTQVIETNTEKDVLSFLKNQKYQVIEFNDKGYFQYKLTEEMLSRVPASKIWSFSINSKEYIGKDIEEHYAVVKNHPLEKKYPGEKIQLIILKSEGKIIGGIAYSNFNDSNTIFNLDGSIIN